MCGGFDGYYDCQVLVFLNRKDVIYELLFSAEKTFDTMTNYSSKELP
jgi:hypothetical protein